MLTSLGIHALCGCQEVDILQNPTMNQFVTDTLLSSDSMQAGIFDRKEIEHMVQCGAGDTTPRSGLEFALDVALAQKNFLKS